jgi:hypothetical protein
MQKTDDRHRRLLGANFQRPSSRATKQCKEFPALHKLPNLLAITVASHARRFNAKWLPRDAGCII